MATACALPASERTRLAREQLDSKARRVEALIIKLDQIRFIALAPHDDVDWEQPDSDVRDMLAFLATVDLLKNIVIATDDDWQLDSQELNGEEFLDILDHLRSWVLATGAEMEQLDVQVNEKDTYLAVLTLINDIEDYIDGEASNKEAFLTALDWLKKMTIITCGDWEQIDEIDEQEVDLTALKAVNSVLREIDSFTGTIDTYYLF